ncbi:MAG: hypothetical protein IPG34_13435 [Rhodocyclaceae bacterium]|nr:hypothetical protein [Rhodocyclaceae bacterium]
MTLRDALRERWFPGPRALTVLAMACMLAIASLVVYQIDQVHARALANGRIRASDAALLLQDQLNANFQRIAVDLDEFSVWMTKHPSSSPPPQPRQSLKPG